MTEPHDGVFNTVQPSMTDGLRWMSVNFTDTDKAIESTLGVKAEALRQLAAMTSKATR
ncbi:MAG: hypothetical protein GY856_36555 [bacterium]|nr:hypothetical protein [bacterium]